MSEMRYPVGIQTFEKIRKGGCLYVDKTGYIHDLVTHGVYYFLSRPRRSGKSLLISTLEALFRGRRDLFKGLAIDGMEWDWKEYPVMHFDFSTKEYTDDNSFSELVCDQLGSLEKEYGCECGCDYISSRFHNLIRAVYEKTNKKVVILVDNYDEPLLQTFHNTDLRKLFQEKIQMFWSGLKTMDPFIEFALLTGVTQYGKG